MASGQGQHEYHVTPLKTYFQIYAALLVFTVITVWIAQFNFGVLNTFIAMLIATIKVILVLGWFMHLKYEGLLNRVTIGSTLLFVAIFYCLIGMDVFTRKTMTEYNSIQRPAPNTKATINGKTETKTDSQPSANP